MSLEPITEQELAAVVTYLEMRARPAELAIPPSPLRLQRREGIAPDGYRTLFRKVGAPWLWFSRLVASDEELTALFAGNVDLWAVANEAGEDVGMLELDFREPGECELSFVGLVPDLSGKGHGRWLLAEAIARAWRDDVARVHVYTCTLDHPAALGAYQRAGFVPFKRAIERFADPRVAGLLPLDTAPQIPLLGTPASVARCA
jgi:GNAT superfamily N-acetyltransferase